MRGAQPEQIEGSTGTPGLTGLLSRQLPYYVVDPRRAERQLHVVPQAHRLLQQYNGGAHHRGSAAHQIQAQPQWQFRAGCSIRPAPQTVCSDGTHGGSRCSPCSERWKGKRWGDILTSFDRQCCFESTMYSNVPCGALRPGALGCMSRRLGKLLAACSISDRCYWRHNHLLHV